MPRVRSVLCYVVPLLVHIVTYWTKFYRHLLCYCTVLCFTANVTQSLRLKDEIDGIWTSCGLPRRRFGRGYMVTSVFMTIRIL